MLVPGRAGWDSTSFPSAFLFPDPVLEGIDGSAQCVRLLPLRRETVSMRNADPLDQYAVRIGIFGLGFRRTGGSTRLFHNDGESGGVAGLAALGLGLVLALVRQHISHIFWFVAMGVAGRFGGIGGVRAGFRAGGAQQSLGTNALG